MKMRLTIVLLTLVLFAGCKSSKIGDSSHFENEVFGVEGASCTEQLDPNPIDSRVGTLSCGEMILHYDYGRYSNRGPLSAEEDFQRSFDSYHHIKFFEDRMIDPKVYKIFLDSVSVIDVREIKAEDKLMFDCETCNAVSELSFMGETYYFPSTMSKNQLSDGRVKIHFEEKNGYRYKYYQREGESPGVNISPIRNRYRKKNCLSVTVKESSQTNEQVMGLLKRVYLK